MKIVRVLGLRAKLQSGEGVPAVTAATDAVQLAENPVLKISYAADGSRKSVSPATMGHQPRVAPSGRIGETTLKLEPRGPNSAYGASNLPFFHALARLAGLDSVLTTTPGLESVSYSRTPGPSGFAIGSLDLYSRGQLWGLTDVYADWTIGATGIEIPMLEFSVKGLLPNLPTDVAVPTMTYGASKDVPPPKAATMGLLFNSVALPRPRSWSIKGNRTLSPRMDQNSAGHGGWGPSKSEPMLELTYENTALATFNPYALWDAGTLAAWEFTIGATQYNRHKFSGPAGQIIDVSDEADGDVATVKLSVQLNPSSLGSNDEFAWLWN
jgi:hypothetical protein